MSQRSCRSKPKSLSIEDKESTKSLSNTDSKQQKVLLTAAEQSSSDINIKPKRGTKRPYCRRPAPTETSIKSGHLTEITSKRLKLAQTSEKKQSTNNRNNDKSKSENIDLTYSDDESVIIAESANDFEVSDGIIKVQASASSVPHIKKEITALFPHKQEEKVVIETKDTKVVANSYGSRNSNSNYIDNASPINYSLDCEDKIRSKRRHNSSSSNEFTPTMQQNPVKLNTNSTQVSVSLQQYRFLQNQMNWHKGQQHTIRQMIDQLDCSSQINLINQYNYKIQFHQEQIRFTENELLKLSQQFMEELQQSTTSPNIINAGGQLNDQDFQTKSYHGQQNNSQHHSFSNNQQSIIRQKQFESHHYPPHNRDPYTSDSISSHSDYQSSNHSHNSRQNQFHSQWNDKEANSYNNTQPSNYNEYNSNIHQPSAARFSCNNTSNQINQRQQEHYYMADESFNAIECIKAVRYNKLKEDLIYKDLELEILRSNSNNNRKRY